MEVAYEKETEKRARFDSPHSRQIHLYGKQLTSHGHPVTPQLAADVYDMSQWFVLALFVILTKRD